MMKPLLRITIAVLFCALLCEGAYAQRTALLIGNEAYAVGRLTNPPNDVRAMAQALASIGFKVETVLNANQTQLRRALRDFASAANDAEIALVYYSGHAVQSKGENYMIPIGATIGTESDYEIEGVSLNVVLRQIETARPRTAVLVLDACRDNPYGAFNRSGTKGLSRMDAPNGMLIGFAAAPNTTASDDGRYAAVLSREIVRPGIELLDVFRNTSAEVYRLSGGRQEPRISEVSIRGRIYMAGAPTDATRPAAPPAANDEYARIEDVASILRQRLRTTTLAQIKQMADRRDPEAMFLYGLARLDGIETDKDAADARTYMRAAARAGFPRASKAYGAFLYHGIGGSRSVDEAVAWWTDSAAQGFAPSQHDLGEHYCCTGEPNSRNHSKAREYFLKAASQGYPPSIMRLGDVYANGWGVPADPGKAMAIYEDAAARGSRPARERLAYAWRWGTIVPMDKKKALRAYLEAGDAAGYREAGLMLVSGELGEERTDEGYRYFVEGAKLGDARALDRALVAWFRGQVSLPEDWVIGKKVDEALNANQPQAPVEAIHALAEGRAGKVKAADPRGAATIAREVYARLRAAPKDSEAAAPWWIRAVGWFLIQRLRDGTLAESRAGERAELEALWGTDEARDFRLLDVDLKCGVTGSFPVKIAVWNASSDVEPAQAQFDWFRDARSCAPPASVREPFLETFRAARARNLPYSGAMADQAAFLKSLR